MSPIGSNYTDSKIDTTRISAFDSSKATALEQEFSSNSPTKRQASSRSKEDRVNKSVPVDINLVIIGNLLSKLKLSEMLSLREGHPHFRQILNTPQNIMDKPARVNLRASLPEYQYERLLTGAIVYGDLISDIGSSKNIGNIYNNCFDLNNQQKYVSMEKFGAVRDTYQVSLRNDISSHRKIFNEEAAKSISGLHDEFYANLDISALGKHQASLPKSIWVSFLEKAHKETFGEFKAKELQKILPKVSYLSRKEGQVARFLTMMMKLSDQNLLKCMTPDGTVTMNGGESGLKLEEWSKVEKKRLFNRIMHASPDWRAALVGATGQEWQHMEEAHCRSMLAVLHKVQHENTWSGAIEAICSRVETIARPLLPLVLDEVVNHALKPPDILDGGGNMSEYYLAKPVIELAKKMHVFNADDHPQRLFDKVFGYGNDSGFQTDHVVQSLIEAFAPAAGQGLLDAERVARLARRADEVFADPEGSRDAEHVRAIAPALAALEPDAANALIEKATALDLQDGFFGGNSALKSVLSHLGEVPDQQLRHTYIAIALRCLADAGDTATTNVCAGLSEAVKYADTNSTEGTPSQRSKIISIISSRIRSLGEQMNGPEPQDGDEIDEGYLFALRADIDHPMSDIGQFIHNDALDDPDRKIVLDALKESNWPVGAYGSMSHHLKDVDIKNIYEGSLKKNKNFGISQVIEHVSENIRRDLFAELLPVNEKLSHNAINDSVKCLPFMEKTQRDRFRIYAHELDETNEPDVLKKLGLIRSLDQARSDFERTSPATVT